MHIFHSISYKQECVFFGYKHFNKYFYIHNIPSLHVDVPLPNVTAIQPKSNASKYNVEHTPNMECYSHHTFQYHVIWYPVISGVPDVTQLQNGTFPSSDTVVIDGLMSDMEYNINITTLVSDMEYNVNSTAKCGENGDVVSDPLFLNVTTLGE